MTEGTMTHTLCSEKKEAEKNGYTIAFTPGGYAALTEKLTECQAVLLEFVHSINPTETCTKANNALRQAINTLNDNIIISKNA